jgi:uncharacterized cupredoxin-like copper-binding protein
MIKQRHLPTTCAALLVATLALAACGDDDDSASDTVSAGSAVTTEAPAEEPAPETTTPETTGTPAADVETLEVTMEDFHYGALPTSVPAGTPVAVSNASEGELHEFVAFRLPDGDERTATEIMGGDLGALLGGGEPAMVLIAPPGSSEQIVAVGEPTFAEPGRYLVLCAIPTGADPQAYMEAAATSAGPPEVDGGPPHFMNGMYAVIEVSA